MIVTLINLILPWTHTEERNDVQYKFTQTDSSYTFYGRFIIHADTECLLQIFFNYEHIRALAPDAKEVLLTDEGDDWNKIHYTYQKFNYFENKSLWHRKLDKENQRVVFTLISSENNKTIMPEMISSSGFYQAKQRGNDIIVEYYQQCKITKSSITNMYLSRVKKEAIQFMKRFSKYTNKKCSSLTN